jgi:hypothetical protein
MEATMEKAHKKPHFTLIGQNSVNAAWNGSPTTLNVNSNISVPQTPNGTTILAVTNQATQNNSGSLAITSGGSQPQFLTVPALANQPSILIQNWQANNLSLTNVSANNATPILVQLVGPGMPGITPGQLTIGTPSSLKPGDIVQGNASPQWMQLIVQSTAATLAIVGFIGGPPDNTGNNGYVVAVNAAQNTGPGTGLPAPQGYYATTTSNSYTYQFNWGSSLVFVANLSPATAANASVTMRAL